MTKIIVQHFVENLLKVLKVLKTRKRVRNGLAELRIRYARQGAKAPFKTKEQKRELQNHYKHQKSLKKLLTSGTIKSQKGAEKHDYQRKRLNWKEHANNTCTLKIVEVKR